jgi:branched-chain amino acid transport system permease protein
MQQKKWLRYTLYFLCTVALILLPLVFSSYTVSLLTEILIYGILALSLNLLVGYTGLPSFGHAAFFGVGAYALALLSTKLITGGGFLNFFFVTGLAVFASLLISMVFGIIVVRSSGVTFLMLTLALAQVLWAVSISWQSLTKGDDGIADILRPDLGLSFSLGQTVNFYYFVLFFFIVSYAILLRIVKSPFGHALIGIRENELRMRAMGFNTWACKYLAYIIAGVFGGLAGVLHAYFNRYVNPHVLTIDVSGTVMLMVIVGSRNVFLGPLIGAAGILLLTHLVGSVTEYWPFVLGTVFVVSVMYARKGVASYFIDYVAKQKRGSSGSVKT